MNRTILACIMTGIGTLVISQLLSSNSIGVAYAAEPSTTTLQYRIAKLTDSKTDAVIPKAWKLLSITTDMSNGASLSVLWFTDAKGNLYKAKVSDAGMHTEVLMIPIEN